jgi:homocysteine S-methyltransferase
VGRYRTALPQLDGGTFVTDGGIETTLIFHDGLELPLFAAFTLLGDAEGTAALRRYFEPYAGLARDSGLGLVLESPTWRASPGWARRLGYADEELDALNRKAIALLAELRDAYETPETPVVISGCVGPEGDGYSPAAVLGADEAERYHAVQIGTFADTEADMVCALTMTYAGEAIGVTRAAQGAGLPVAVSFTVETDGRLPSGQGLAEAIEEVELATDGAPAYYMVNCAHPTHFEHVFAEDAAWAARVGGLRANASAKSHAELDEAEELDAGDPADLARRHAALRDRLPAVRVLGGCCGTDHRHVAEIVAAWTS